MKIIVAATEFRRCDLSHKFKLVWIRATYCSDKLSASDLSQQQCRRGDLSQQQCRRGDVSQQQCRRGDVSQQQCRRGDLSQRHVAAICRIVCLGRYSTLNSLTLLWLADSEQWIFEISDRDVITADYTIIMSRTLKVTGNHVMYDCNAWFPRVIMSTSHNSCCLPSVKKQKHDFQVFQSMYNKTLLDSVFVISRIIKVSVRVISRSRILRPWLFWISQKPHPLLKVNLRILVLF